MGWKSTLILGAALAAAVPALAEPRGTSNDGLKFRDYPAESLKNGEEGVVHYRVAINKKGEPMSCEVTGSSGYPRLDEATCQMIVFNAKFNRAAGKNQKRWIYDGKVEWRINAPNS